MNKFQLVTALAIAFTLFCSFAAPGASRSALPVAEASDVPQNPKPGDQIPGSTGDTLVFKVKGEDKPQEVNVLSDTNGKVNSFNLKYKTAGGEYQTLLFVWDEDEDVYNPTGRAWDYLRMEDLGHGIFKFEIINAWTGSTARKGSVSVK